MKILSHSDLQERIEDIKACIERLSILPFNEESRERLENNRLLLTLLEDCVAGNQTLCEIDSSDFKGDPVGLCLALGIPMPKIGEAINPENN